MRHVVRHLISFRTALRLALRGLRRQLRANWLVVVLIALPVALGVWWSVAQRTISDQEVPAAQLAGVGNAEVILRFAHVPTGNLGTPVGARKFDDGGVVVSEAASAIVALEGSEAEVVGLWSMVNEASWAGGSVEYFAQGRAKVADWNGDLARSMFHRIDGRLPLTSGEVAMDDRLADRLGLKVGDSFVDRSPLKLEPATVVGTVTPVVTDQFTESMYLPPAAIDLVVAPSLEAQSPAVNYSTRYPRVGLSIGVSGLSPTEVEETLAAAGFDSSGANSELGSYRTVDGAGLERLNGVRRPDGLINPGERPEQAGVLVSSALLVEAALLASAAFAVRGRRRMSEIGRLTAMGASPSHVQSMMLVEATLLGLCGAALGALVAGGAMVVGVNPLAGMARPWSASEVAHGFEMHISPWDLLLPVGPAILAAVLAAWLPARRAARQDPHVAVAAASPPRRPIAGSGWIGLGLLVTSGVLLLVALDASGGVIGAVASTVSLLALVGAAMAFAYRSFGWLERRGGGLPLGLRLGLRQVTRNRLRSVVLVGSMAVIAMTAVIVLTMFNLGRMTPRPDATFALVTDGTPLLSGVGDSVEPVDEQSLRQVAAAVDVDHSAAVSVITDGEGGVVSASFPWRDRLWPDHAVVAATPALIDLLQLDAEAVDALNRPGTLLVTSGVGWSADKALNVTMRSRSDHVRLETFRVDIPGAFGAGVAALINPDHIPEGFAASAETSGWLVQSADGFKSSERSWMMSSGAVQMEMIVNPWAQNVAAQMIGLLMAGGLILVIGRVASGLVAVESDAGTTIAVAVGASPALRRRLLAAQSAWVTALAVVVSMPLGVGFVWLLYVADRDSFTFIRQGEVPLLPGAPLYFIAALMLVPPASALLVGLTSRSSPTAVSRRLT